MPASCLPQKGWQRMPLYTADLEPFSPKLMNRRSRSDRHRPDNPTTRYQNYLHQPFVFGRTMACCSGTLRGCIKLTKKQYYPISTRYPCTNVDYTYLGHYCCPTAHDRTQHGHHSVDPRHPGCLGMLQQRSVTLSILALPTAQPRGHSSSHQNVP